MHSGTLFSSAHILCRVENSCVTIMNKSVCGVASGIESLERNLGSSLLKIICLGLGLRKNRASYIHCQPFILFPKQEYDAFFVHLRKSEITVIREDD